MAVILCSLARILCFAFPLNVGLQKMFVMCQEKNACLDNKCHGMLIHIPVSLCLWQLTTYSRGFIFNVLFILPEGLPTYDRRLICIYNIKFRSNPATNHCNQTIPSVNIMGFEVRLLVHRPTPSDTMHNKCTYTRILEETPLREESLRRRRIGVRAGDWWKSLGILSNDEF